MELLKPVIINNEPWSFDRYCTTLSQEQRGTIAYYTSDAVTWDVPASLAKKVAQDGTLKPFFGDTIVVNVSQNDRQKLLPAQQKMADHADLWPQSLAPETMHMTVHDLSNGANPQQLCQKMADNQQHVTALFSHMNAYFAEFPELSTLTMKQTAVYPCLNISLLVGLMPASERDFKVLMNFYNLFDAIAPLDYWPRFHITLSYFKPQVYQATEIKRLGTLLTEMNQDPVTFTFDLKQAIYQHFEDMNTYRDQHILCKSPSNK